MKLNILAGHTKYETCLQSILWITVESTKKGGCRSTRYENIPFSAMLSLYPSAHILNDIMEDCPFIRGIIFLKKCIFNLLL